jgi:hypothetical protein
MSGNVGIGTTSPAFPLTFAQSLGDKLALYPSVSGSSYGFGIQSFLLQIHTDTSAADIAFGSGPSTNFVETMRIKGTGNVGIGTTTPGLNTLQINPTTISANGYGLVVSRADYGQEIQINRGPGQAGLALVVDNAGNGDANTSMLLIRNNMTNSGQTVMNVLASGNVGIGTATPTNRLHVIGGATFSSGAGGANQNVVWVPGSASWSFTSDRAAKDRVEPVNAQSVLDKVSRIAINEWSYIGYDQRHIGPMAQDFHEQFPLNPNDKALNDADLHGVALAAIQGLNEKVEGRSQKAEGRIRRLEEENTALKAELSGLKAMVQAMNERLNGGDK